MTSQDPRPKAPPPPARTGSISARARGAASGPAYLDGLNPEQRQAVETLDGPVLVLAGAGTGKTRVLTTRIAHILATGRARGQEILAVTFTNKAAREMKERIGHLIGGAVEGMPWLGTFHSIGVKILRRHAELVGLKSGFTILDSDDQLRLMKQVIESAGLDKDRWPGRQLASLIDSWKNRGFTPDQVPKGESFAFGNGKGRDLYAAYQQRLKELNACDFGDLLLENLRLFREHPDILAQYQRRFRYMLVDEYQDTNVVQYLWLRLLAASGAPPAHDQAHHQDQAPQAIEPGADEPDEDVSAVPFDDEAPEAAAALPPDDDTFPGDRPTAPATIPLAAPPASRTGNARASRLPPNVCCVGDDDQSIYGWRGAEVDNILRFEKDFPGAVVIRLERNYRSTGNILASASHLIAHNQGRLGKTLFTDGSLGNKVCVTGVWDDAEEARIIGEDIEGLRKDGHRLNQIAILVRASFQMRAFEDRFVTLGLPYRVIGGPRFYERQEIKDAIAYLEVTINPANDLKFERIVNTPKRGLGDTTIKRLHDLARARQVPLSFAARDIVESEELSPKARRALGGLLLQFENWRRRSAEIPHTELAELILDESGYTAMWQQDKSPQAQSRLENLKELVRFMGEFDTLQGFLEHVSLVMDTDSGADDGDRVSLMTLHAAKGLEFDTVFLPGWEEGLFPHQRSLDESGLKGLEEERRLAYVGLTRARKAAKVSFAENRRNRGLFQAATPSRFVDELPEAHVAVIEAKSPFGGAYRNFANPYGNAGNPYGRSRFDDRGAQPFSASYATPGWQRAQKRWKKGPQTRSPLLIEGELAASATETSAFGVGDRVFHEKFGYGRVAEVEGNKLTVDFDKAGQKRVVDSFVKGA